ncbi:ornithine cyclodeaminase family protein [Corynebacterium freneyi]|uniref:ornithine cyclodeaminase family protein n=1 Tax=Corynebacterium freneyi TaxID=134034 RepID=UPI002549FEBC|nr:ornithine cyclodeaminase family protein [Corynebacterium freneyi]MDK8767550.1 ornithine cyclodeaminase family protein [Corynebacterium freneyi]
MRVVDSAAVRSAMTVGRAAYVLRAALLEGLDPAADIPRGGAEVPSGGHLLWMPSTSRDHAGVKLLTAGGDPWIQGAYLLFDGPSLAPVALIDGPALTDVRTPAVSFAGVLEILSARRRPGAPLRVAIIGSGPQAVHHALGAAELFGEGPDGEGVDVTFVVRTPRDIDCDVPHTVATELPADADFIVCATSASEPVLDDADVADHAVVVAMGAHDPAKRELSGELMGRAAVIVEDPHVAETECGDVMIAVDEGHLERGDWTTFRDVVVKQDLARELAAADAPIVFKTAGMSWEDLAVAVEVVARL